MAAPGTPGDWLKPNASAVLTSFSAPSLAPSGAKTELHDFANDTVSEPPQAEPNEFSSFTPLSVAAVSTGNCAVGVVVLFSSAPATVIILKVEPEAAGR